MHAYSIYCEGHGGGSKVRGFQGMDFNLMIGFSSSVQKQMLELLDGWLRHKSDMVNFEAARAICEMRNVTAAQLTKPISGQ